MDGSHQTSIYISFQMNWCKKQIYVNRVCLKRRQRKDGSKELLTLADEPLSLLCLTADRMKLSQLIPLSPLSPKWTNKNTQYHPSFTSITSITPLTKVDQQEYCTGCQNMSCLYYVLSRDGLRGDQTLKKILILISVGNSSGFQAVSGLVRNWVIDFAPLSDAARQVHFPVGPALV